ncbi:MAG: uroporphyrinogen decarboxylase family protein [Phycisphaeraceae bacterium]
MSTATLTSRQRVHRAMEHRDHDRVPRHDNYWPETIARWQGEGFDGDVYTVLDHLGSDLHRLPVPWVLPFPGQRRTLEEDQNTCVVQNEWGQTERLWKHRSGTPEHLGFGCESRQVWEDRYKPALLNQPHTIDDAELRRWYRAGRERGKWCFLSGIETFEATRRLMGDEITMIAFAEDPEWIVDVSRTYTDAVLRRLDAAMATGIEPDGVWMYGDMAYNSGTFCSPRMYRELVWPDHKRMADWAHARGMKFIFHTDGDIRAVIDDYADAGFDMIQPLEAKANVDIRELAPRYGERIGWFGNIDMTVAGTNNLEQLEHEVRTKLEAGKAVRGYAYHSDHSVPPTVCWATYQHLIELVDRHGNYET